MFATNEFRHRKIWQQSLRILIVAGLLCFCKTASAQIRYSVYEENNQGSIVGNIAKDLGLDIGKLGERRFRIVSASGEPPFQVNQNTGVLYVNRNIDREVLCERNSLCLINLKTVVENPLEIHYVGVEIVDINDHSPSFPEKEKRLEIAESTLPGTRFPLETAHDPDVGVNALRSYKLSQNEHFELEIKDRGEDNKIPILILKKSLDRELHTAHRLLLTALDSGQPQRSGTLNISVVVLDINDNSPVFEKEVYAVTLKENAPIGTFVIKVNATDLDEGPNGEVVFSFGNNIRSKVYDIFNLDVNTGEITVKGLIDFEEKDMYEIDVQATDRGPVPFTVHCSVVVKIEDVNDNAPEIEVTSLSSVIAEDSSLGTVIALVNVADIDSGINGQVVCSLLENMPFELKPSFQDNLYSLVTKKRLDRETISYYNISIIAKDRGQPSLSSFKTVNVTISDINDNSPKFSQTPYTFYLYENNVPGASVFSVSASDIDQDENARVSYEILRGDHVDSGLTSFISVNYDTGNIYALKSFDFEELKTFEFQVTAKDCGVPALSSNATVKVFILDQNDNAPVILSPLSSNGSAEAVEEIHRNVNPGYLVTKVRVYDADIGYNAWLSFSLLQVSDPSLFSLERYTGEIRTLRSFTETDSSEHKLIIQVKDNGNVSLSASATIHITTVESIESSAVSEFKNTAKRQEENNVTFYLIVSLGSVSSLFLVSIITLVAMQCCRSMTRISSRSSMDKNYADVSGNGTLCHSIQYRAGEKRYMLVGPRMSIGSTIGVGSNRNTLVFAENGSKDPNESKPPNADWRYSASLRAGMQSSVHMEESAILQGAPGVLVQNWPTVSSATGGEPEGGEVSPPVGAGINSNSWSFRYGPGPGHPQALKPGEVPEAFIIPGSPAIISIRQDQPTGDDKSDFITFGKKEETKKKKKKKKGKADKKEKGNNDNSEQ
ncbi:protocadherin alpha-8-like isoform X6 [Lepisosteus oculatus]|uniref:protocadherin alpha-8-like isoform X6 n=1 Tax=Lepisosteus oculatus TaxID=7918 RepID=UPI0035F507E9